MDTTQVAHALVDSYVFQKAVVHSDYEALAREIAVMLDAAAFDAYERAAQVAEAQYKNAVSATQAFGEWARCAQKIEKDIRALATAPAAAPTE